MTLVGCEPGSPQWLDSDGRLGPHRSIAVSNRAGTSRFVKISPLWSYDSRYAIRQPSVANVSPVESKTPTYHGRVGSGRTAGWRGGVEQDLTFNIELANGDLDVAVDKLGEVQKMSGM